MAPSIYRLMMVGRPRWRCNAFRTVIGLTLIALTAGGAGRLDSAESGSRPADARWPFAKKWLGDFNAMVKERRIRVLVAYSKTYYFLDRGQQRGATYEVVKEFEKYVNKKLKSKTLPVQVVIIPVRRDELVAALVGGFGDIAAANLTITAERKRQVHFSAPFLTGVDELLVTGPAVPALTGLDDLAGKEIHVRRSSSYYESLVHLNDRFKKNGRPEMAIVAADESLEDEDLLEMVNAGLIPMIVVDSHKARFWAQIFEAIRVHDDIAVRTGGEIAWMFRRNSPQLAAVVNKFAANHKKGTLFGNMVLKRYLRDTTYVKNSLSPQEIDKFTRMVNYFKTYADQYD
ncbi:MAG: transporter substrate-binding domain-containing protein, partial [Desulfobacterales bacterium]